MSENFANTGTLDIMKKSKTNFFYSSVFLDEERRDALRTVYAFCRLTDDIADDEGSDIVTKKKNLAEWKAGLETALNTDVKDGFFAELKKQIDRFKIPHQPFLDLIRGMEMDLDRRKYRTFGELYDYCYCVASCVGLMSIEIFGYSDERIKDYAVKLGVALQLTNIIRDMKKDYEDGRIYLPLEEMERFGYTEEDLKNCVINDNFKRLMEFQYARALDYYREADKCLSGEEKKNMVPAMIMRNVYFKILAKVRKRNYNIFGKKISISKFNKILIASGLYLRYKFLR